LTEFDWVFELGKTWIITDETASHGDFSITTPNIGYNESTKMEISVDIETGYVQFWYRTSTRAGRDYLRFFINDREIGSWSGTNEWTHFYALVERGINKFTWKYERGTIGGSDLNKVWIDQIGFPKIRGHVLYPPQDFTSMVVGRDITLTWETPFVSQMANFEPLTFLGYNLFINGIKQNAELLTTNNFQILHSVGGNLRLWVTAVYEEGESTDSDNIILRLPVAPPRNLKAELEGSGVRLTWDFDYIVTELFGFRVIRNGETITLPPNLPIENTFLDTDFPSTQNYTYQVRTIILIPLGISELSNEATIFVVDCGDCVEPVFVTELGNNYPNPFNPNTSIWFQVSGNLSHESVDIEQFVEIVVYNIRGQRVRTLVNNFHQPGEYMVVWNGRDDNGNPVGSGVYFYRMTAGDFQETRKMMLLK